MGVVLWWRSISPALQMTNLSWALLAFFLLKKNPCMILNKVSTPAALNTESDATVPKYNRFDTPRRVFFYINAVDGRNISGVWAILRPLHCCPCAPYRPLHLFISWLSTFVAAIACAALLGLSTSWVRCSPMLAEPESGVCSLYVVERNSNFYCLLMRISSLCSLVAVKQIWEYL